ncbi:sialidase family protein [Chitinophaga sp. MM2321]|uniref:sialidase family protein n=1 Tax=Chitinophaga sp. MM2321 TaxID=3137178 RepID=UPI0032D59CA7
MRYQRNKRQYSVINIFCPERKMWSMAVFFIAASTLFGCNAAKKNTGAISPDTATVLQLNPGPDNPRNSEGDFITLKNGNILFVYTYFSGDNGDDHGHAYLVSRSSSDQGKTWSKEDKLVVKQEGDMNVMSVSLLRLQNGKIALFYLKKNSMADCIPLMRISDDEAKTWSEPTTCITDRVGYFVLNNNRVIQLKNGRLVMAVALHKVPTDKTWSNSGKLYSYYSDDNGRTWTNSAEVPNPEKIVTQEPGLVELKNGNLLMYIRAGAGVQCLSYSSDKGATWSTIEKSTLVSPLSPATIARVPGTGDLLVVWNNNGLTKYRTPLNIAISKDEGKTWGNIKTLEDDKSRGYCYTAIHFTSKHVLLGYCAGSQASGSGAGILSQTDIKRLSLDWIYK